MESKFFEKLLNYFNLTLSDYEQLTKIIDINEIHSYENFPHINEACDLCRNFIRDNKKICIYGDYDADGIMSTSILVKAFQYLGFKAQFYIPSRYLDGYGLSVIHAQKIIKAGYDMVITVDNGITANEAIQTLKDAGLKVLILDHHQRQGELPNADFIFHPTISGYGEIASSAGFVSFMFASALLGRYDKYLATLASISLISDMMPLKAYNRQLLQWAIRNYIPGEFPSISLLLEEDQPFNEVGIGMQIAPKINAVGRVMTESQVNRVVTYFVTDNIHQIESYHAWLNKINNLRKEKSQAAKELLKEELKRNKNNDPALVLSVDIEEGLLGLVANSLMNEFKKPVVVFTTDSKDEGVLKGSARSMEGFHIVKAFNEAKDLTLTYGGHAFAGGVSLKKENLEEFKKIFNKCAEEHKILPPNNEGIIININDITLENVRILESFGPFGEEWKRPTMILQHIKTDQLKYSKDGQHIITYIGLGSKLVGFNVDRKLINETNYIDIYGTIRTGVFKNRTFGEFLIKRIEKTQK